jgi:DNA-binding response OmpR family regulator
MARILIVEDEAQMRQGLKDNLEFEGYEVDTAEDGEEGLNLAEKNQYNLLLLDVMLPKISGFDVCKQLRSKGYDNPIIMLTAKGEEIDKVLGLELGADDYITKPFSLRELLARVKAVLRREGRGKNTGVAVTLGKIEVNFSTFEALENGQPVALTHREFEVLKFLWEHENQVVSREDLMEEVWGLGDVTTSRTVDNFILKLRQTIEEDPAHPRHIITVHGIGYKYLP